MKQMMELWATKEIDELKLSAQLSFSSSSSAPTPAVLFLDDLNSLISSKYVNPVQGQQCC